MIRRAKLTRAERDKRSAKRQHRAENVIPIKRGRELKIKRYEDAMRAYADALVDGLKAELRPDLRGGRCICERCGQEQDIGDGMVLESGEVTIAECESCGHEYGMSHEAYAELVS